jgi:putative membrane protein
MRLRPLVALAGAAVLAVVAGAGVAAAVRGTTLSTQDTTFLTTAHQTDLVGIDAGRLAGQRAADPVVRRLATEMAADHSRFDSDVRTVAQRLDVPLPARPDATQQAELATVARQSGAGFDSAWLRLQIVAHDQALAAGQAELAEGSNAEVKALAQRAVPLLRTHLLAFEQALGASAADGVNAGDGGQAASPPSGSGTVGWTLLGVAAVLVVASLVLFGPRRHGVATLRP